MGILSTFLKSGSFRAATPENPQFNLNSPDAWDALTDGRSVTGEGVSPENALHFSPWFRGVSILARDVAKTPLNIFKFSGDGDHKTIDRKHAAYRLLRWRCNDFQTVFQFRQAIMGHAVNRGNGYAYIDRNRGGVPLSLTLLDPDTTEPHANAGRIWYVVKTKGEERKLPAEDVFHIRGFGFDGLRGYPAFQIARDIIAVGKAQLKYKGLRFKNAARPGVVLESPNPIKQNVRQELRNDWERMHTGLDNSHRTAILDNGLKMARIAFTAEEMQEVEQMGLTINDVSNILGVPASKLNNGSAVKYKSKEDDDQSYLDDGLDYWFYTFEDEARDKLFSESEKDDETHAVLFNRQSLIRADLTAKTMYWRTATGGRSWASPNEAREAFDLEPSDADDADDLLTPLNMGQGGHQNEPANPNPPAPQDRGPAKAETFPAQREAAGLVVADACRRMVARLGEKGKRAAKKSGADYLEWLDALAPDDATVAAFEPAANVVASLGGAKIDLAASAVGALRAGLLDTANATAAQLQDAVGSALDKLGESVARNVICGIWGTPCAD